MGHLSMGMINDILTESFNDGYEYPYKATQADMDNF